MEIAEVEIDIFLQVFGMLRSGTGGLVEAVDVIFQSKTMDMLRQTEGYADGRKVDGEGWVVLTLFFC